MCARNAGATFTTRAHELLVPDGRAGTLERAQVGHGRGVRFESRVVSGRRGRDAELRSEISPICRTC
jgi:hypothetical protein